METILEILKIGGLGLLGIVIYALVTVWKKIKTNGFDGRKFFNENIPFWSICIALNILFAIVIVVVPDFKEVLHFIGFAIESEDLGGFVLLGIALGAGSDKTVITGPKKLNTKINEYNDRES